MAKKSTSYSKELLHIDKIKAKIESSRIRNSVIYYSSDSSDRKLSTNETKRRKIKNLDQVVITNIINK